METERQAAEANESALAEAEAARRDAEAAEARAAEREHQMEVLIAALQERTSEVDRLKQREAMRASAADEERTAHARALETVVQRAGETERELRRTLAESERRLEADRHALRAAAEVDRVRAVREQSPGPHSAPLRPSTGGSAPPPRRSAPPPCPRAAAVLRSARRVPSRDGCAHACPRALAGVGRDQR